MAITPFHDIPKKSFLIQMLGPCIVLFAFFFLAVGVVATSSEFQKLEGPSQVIPFWDASFRHYHQLFAQLSSAPSFCLLGPTVNEFQKHQCDEFWSSLIKSGSLSLLPFIMVLVFLYFGLESLNSLYRRAQKKIEKGVGALAGTVTHPPDASADLFSWFYRFRPVMVELPNREQIKVYVPKEAASPSAGAKLVIYPIGQVLGEKRQIAMVYIPHIAVVRGN